MEDRTHIQYALYHRPTGEYVYSSEEGGEGLNGTIPFLLEIDNWSSYFDDDGNICLEDGGDYHIDEFETHEYECKLMFISNVGENETKNRQLRVIELQKIYEETLPFVKKAEEEIIKVRKDNRLFEEGEVDDILNNIDYNEES